MTLTASIGAAQDGRVPAGDLASGGVFIVQLRVPANADAGVIALAQDDLLRELASAPYRVRRRYASLPFMALELSAAALDIVASSPLVIAITEDIALRPNAPPSLPATGDRTR